MNYRTKEELIAFENEVKRLWEDGELPFLIHLCGGNEDVLIKIFKNIEPGDWIFSGHRSHYHYLLAGGDPGRLMAMIRRGDSMFVFDRALNFVTSSVLGGTACIAAGVAHAIKAEGSRMSHHGGSDRLPHVWCFLGDGAEEQGHFYEAVMMVEGHGLPCTFIVEDNDRSVDTNIAQRRGDAGKGTLKLSASCIVRYSYVPTYPHAGSGCSHKIVFKEISR